MVFIFFFIRILEESEKKENPDKREDKDHPDKQLQDGNMDEGKRKNNIRKTFPDNKQGDASSIPASPLARKLARDNGVDITKLEGTGPRQRITKHDVENIINQKNENIGNSEIDTKESDAKKIMFRIMR